MTLSKTVSYKSTTYACYIGNIIQAAVVNLTPVLFIPLKDQFGLTFTQLGILIAVNFITQFICDIIFSGLIDKYGFRRFIVSAHALCVFGFVLFALTPFLFSNVYVGFIISTIIFSGAGGLLEVLLSPIVNAIPTDEKAAAMSVLHSFYAWGQVLVVLLTTLLIFVLGREAWWLIILMWAIIPLLNFFFFLKVPLAPSASGGEHQGMKQLVKHPFFWVCALAILLGGASEIGISQWSSSFMEKAMKLPKLLGDTAGMCMFAAMLGVGRLFYGIYGKKINVNKFMIFGSVLAIACYLCVAISSNNILSLFACAICGFGVSLLWPGTLVIASERFPLAGAWIFAILAAGGDIGGSIGPSLMSVVVDNGPKLPIFQDMINSGMISFEQLGLRLGMFAGALFPIGAFLCLLWLYRDSKKYISKKIND